MDDLRHLLLFTRDDPTSGNRKALSRQVRTGGLRRLADGVYVDTDDWAGLDDRRRHLLRAHAVQQLRRRRLVFSHQTAAAAWDLPFVEPLPAAAHVVAPQASGGRTDDGLVRHCVGIPGSTTLVDGLEVTDLGRTALDVARTASFTAAVATMDAALARLGDARDLRLEIGPPRARGVARCRRVLDFADARSGSPGESVSRVSIALAGLPPPMLQHTFTDAFGRIIVDFWWPRFNLVGEFDGAVKYDSPEFLRGRSPQQALLDEKDREDRIRALGPRVVRWRWNVARSPARLGALLAAAGLRDERYRDW